jgi:hypothetical protein
VEGFNYGVAAVELFFHGWSPRTVFLVCIISRLNAQDPWRAADIILEQRGRAILRNPRWSNLLPLA